MRSDGRSYRDPVFDEVSAREARMQRQAAREAEREHARQVTQHTERWIKRLRIRALVAQVKR